MEFVRLIAGSKLQDLVFWTDARQHYALLIRGHNNFEIAETFFNSVYCATFEHRRVRNEYAFVFSSQGDMPPVGEAKILRNYRAWDGLEAMFTRMLDEYAFCIPWENKARDAGLIAEALRDKLFPEFPVVEHQLQALTLESVFFRNKGAYIVGKLIAGRESMPFVLPILHTEQGSVFVDTVLFGSNKVSIIFSFTRSYFMVDAAIPSQYVLFLQSLMPAKPISEIYSCMGYNKHGKTYFHRCAYRHMTSTTDQFIAAPGIKGMVMSVFTLPSYDFVFKIIKDRFTPPKDMTREQVMEKYSLVKRADRAGRMADTQEFKNLAFARRRFSDELMDELREVAPSMLEEHGPALIIRHVYVERRMVPLNLYLQDATEEQLWAVMDEYGNAIKELAAANIFPGDMLLKNFGVTRHGRVVFYDYDEICPLTECNFRRIPPPRNEEDEMSDTPWYSVAPNDIFPEEFRMFFSGNQRARKVFDELHSDIYEASFWQGLQETINNGGVADFFPYRRKLRFARHEEPLLRAYNG
ncbi:MAG: bifunctional isocitrate dehydrogenase kinase/phosphatase, partial [Halieaceae bacterium]|jgi:isocitrate dehydrogenase kinase/phosphatase|nr:bifunctional isocitrate dehydrogenase kinase/phosphatase [Halieaceae bacterium]